MNWRAKAIAFRFLSVVPGGSRIHFFAQRYLTGTLPRPHKHVCQLLEWARTTISDFTAHSAVAIEQSTFYEVGAGRDLCVPLSLRMLGVRQVLTSDIERLAKLAMVNHAAKCLCADFGRATMSFSSWQEVQDFGVEYIAPYRSLGKRCSIDAWISNEVMEHVPAEALPALLSDGFKILKPGGLAIHAIDYSDHFARGTDLSRYNFLQYSSAQWRPFNSRIQFVNRLRHSEYLDLFRAAGFELVDINKHSGDIPQEVVANLAPEFRRFPLSDLRVLRSRIVARRPLVSNNPNWRDPQ